MEAGGADERAETWNSQDSPALAQVSWDKGWNTAAGEKETDLKAFWEVKARERDVG